MNRLLKFICSSAVMINASSGIFANANEVSQSNPSGQTKSGKQQPPFEQGMGLSDTNMPANKYQPAYNAPACIDINEGRDIDVFGSFIYWYASQQNMEIATEFFVLTPLPQKLSVINQNFEYKPGFKVGFGVNLNYDGWVSWAEYTRFHQTVNGSVVRGVQPLFVAGWNADTGFQEVQSISTSWKMNLDMLDVVFSRPLYEGMQLTVSPYAGMRGWLLRQGMNLAATPLVVGTVIRCQSRNWALGPMAGVLGHWMLGSGFRFEGNSEVSILYTRYTKITYNASGLNQFGFPIIVSSNLRNFSIVCPTVQLGVGLGWGRYFSNNGFYMDLSARYDFSYFWKQNMMHKLSTFLTGGRGSVGDLLTHGLTTTLRVDF